MGGFKKPINYSSDSENLVPYNVETQYLKSKVRSLTIEKNKRMGGLSRF
jgi:hypothetical protein